jgi:hypothetical protein
VRTQAYFGPCRRRRIDHDFTGDERRGVQPAPTAFGGESEPTYDFDPEEVY